MLIPIVYAEDYSNYYDLDLNLNLDSSVDAVSTGDHPTLDSLEITLNFIPIKTIQQDVVSLRPTAIPSAVTTATDSKLVYEWEDAQKTSFSFGYASLVKIKNEFPDLYSKLKHPIEDMPMEAIEYIKPTEKIVVTDDISKKAQEIIGNEHDLYKVVFKLADWTKSNIKYDLNTLTEAVVQDSQWVLVNKEGVCDELTNLFISFLRSQGIPARFVSGMVYSNLNDNWGPHGWAEVYFPGYGWIPYDVTFGQYGWLDPTHIKLKESKDSNEAAANYNWMSRDLEIKPNEISIAVTLNKKGNLLPALITLDLEPLKREVSFNSYIPLRVHLKNNENNYVSEIITIKKAPGVEGSNVKYVALAPKEEKDIYWILKTPEGQSNMVYTSTIEAVSAFGSSATTTVKYFVNGEEVTLSEAESKIEVMEDNGPVSSTYLDFSCKSDKSEYFDYEPANFECTLKNNGGKTLDLNVCFVDSCKTVSVDVDETEHVTFAIDKFESTDVYFVAKNNEIVKYAYPKLTVLSSPTIEITNAEYPEIIRYDQQDNLSFILSSDTTVYDAVIEVENLGKVNIAEFTGKQKITIPFEAYSFSRSGSIHITVTFYDSHKRQYNKEVFLPINVEDIGFFDKIMFWINKIF